jgi:hypothetical protein
MTINVKPLGDRVLVQPLEEKEVKRAASFPTRRERSLRKVPVRPSALGSSTTMANDHRPEGPSVALTALASFSTPRKSACRPASSNCNCFAAIIYPNVFFFVSVENPILATRGGQSTPSRSMQVASGLRQPGRLGPNPMLGGITL